MPISANFNRRQCELATRADVCDGGAVHHILLQQRFHDEHVSSKQHHLSVRRNS